MTNPISFSRRLWISVMTLFIALALCFILYQYRRETTYRSDVIHTKLQAYNDMVVKLIDNPEMWPEDVRVTIMSTSGDVIVDNVDTTKDANHADRPEVKEALSNGWGRDIRRKSATVGEEYFYSATYYPRQNVIVRSALPYNNSLIDMLTADKDFVWLTLVIVLFLAVIYELYTKKIGRKVAAKRHKIERKLVKSEEDKLRMKRQLTQNVAHELKTPVSSIQGFLDILVSSDDLPEEQRQDFLRRCHAQATRLASLLRDISMLTRIDDVPTAFEKTSCQLRDIVENVYTDLAESLSKRGDTFVNNIPSDTTIQGNQGLLYSIFRNLVDNSISYAGTGIAITIEANDHNSPNFVEVTYTDNGVGVPDEHLPFLFERFYRLDKGRSRALGGTGLGLAIVKHAVILHGGTITVTHAPEGGLQFIFTLKKE